MGFPRVVVGLALAAALTTLIVLPATAAAISVTRAELKGTALRVEGGAAVPNATIRVSSPQQSVTGRADGSGAFRVQQDPFSSSTCNVTVSDGSTSATASLSGCTPSQPPPAPVLSGLTLNPATVVGGNNSTGTVSLSGAAPSATTVTLSSSNVNIAGVPASVTIAAASSSASFTITTTAVNASTAVTISASSGATTVSATLTVTPAAPLGAPALSSLTLNPTSVSGGTTSTGTVSLSGAAPSATTVTLSSSNVNVAGVPASVTIAAGATSALFTVTTATAVPASSTVTITAASGGVTKSAALTVTGSSLAISTAGLSCVNGVCELGPGNVGTFFAGFISKSGGTGPTPFDWALIAGRLPDGLTLNDPRQCGVQCVSITGTPTTVQTTSFTIQVQDGAGATAQQAFSITINPPTPVVITNQCAGPEPPCALAPGAVGVNYPQAGVTGTQLFASGGVQPYQWAVAAGSLPPGLTLSASGRISGTPTTAGTFGFTARVTDSAGAQASRSFSIAVSP